MTPSLKRRSRRVTFAGGTGHQLAGILEEPDGDTIGTAVMAHCFTCGKDLKAPARIARNLAAAGIHVLRFDFTGVGDSRGRFDETSFSTNCSDLAAACRFLSDEVEPPRLLFGHSLGGVAALVVGDQLPEIGGLVTLASPSDTQHLGPKLIKMNRQIESEGAGEVSIGGRSWTIQQKMLDDLAAQDIESIARRWQRPLLILHSPDDRTVEMAHAHRLLEWTEGASSLMALPGADHLLVDDPADVVWVSELIAHWARRYVFTATNR